jgi:uncharacterized protein (TIGR00369 family)
MKRDHRTEQLTENRDLPAFFPALGMTVEEISVEKVVVRMKVPDVFWTPFGAIHGGILGALMDTVGGITVATQLTPADRTATHSITIHYTSFVRERTCVCIGRLLAKGKNVATVELEVRRDDGSLAAKALGTFGIFRNKND